MTRYFDTATPATCSSPGKTGTPKTASRCTSATGDRLIDRQRRVVVSEQGSEVGYDAVVLATGSAPFVPAVPAWTRRVYLSTARSKIWSESCLPGKAARAAVMGGGLLGLEAAKAVRDLNLETHVVEFAPTSDAAAGRRRRIADSPGKDRGPGRQGSPRQEHARIPRQRQGRGLALTDGERCSSRHGRHFRGHPPARRAGPECGLEVGPRGGVVVDDLLRTSDPEIFAIGEVALHRGMIYGLVAPATRWPRSSPRTWPATRAASPASTCPRQAQAHGRRCRELRRRLGRGVRPPGAHIRGPVSRDLQEALVQPDGTRLLGGVLGRRRIGVRRRLLGPVQERRALPSPRPNCWPVRRAKMLERGLRLQCGLDAQVCSCNNVSERADPRRHPQRSSSHGRPGQVMHKGRHRLRRLPASGHRAAQSPN